MNPKNLRFLSYAGIFIAMILSGYYSFRTWRQGDPKWYFMILTFGIALIFLYHFISTLRKK